MSPDRQRALAEALAAATALAETGSREVAMDHLRRAHEILADAQHDERPLVAPGRHQGTEDGVMADLSSNIRFPDADDLPPRVQSDEEIEVAALKLWDATFDAHANLTLDDWTRLIRLVRDQARVAPNDLLAAAKGYHRAIDLLFAKMMTLDPTFSPSESPAWAAVVAGHAAIKRAEGGA